MQKLKKNIALIFYYTFNVTFFLLGILCAASSTLTANIINDYPDLKHIEELNSILSSYKDCNAISFFCGLFMLFISLFGLLTAFFGKLFLLYIYITLIVIFYSIEIVLLEFVESFPSKITARYGDYLNKAPCEQAKIVEEAFRCCVKRIDVNCVRCNFTNGFECKEIAFNENVFYIWTSINSLSIGFLVIQFIFITLVQKLKEND